MDLNQLRARVSGGGKKQDLIKSLFQIHHTLMKEYGWISLEELKKTPYDTIQNLLECINDERKAEAKSMKQKKGRGMWRK